MRRAHHQESGRCCHVPATGTACCPSPQRPPSRQLCESRTSPTCYISQGIQHGRRYIPYRWKRRCKRKSSCVPKQTNPEQGAAAQGPLDVLCVAAFLGVQRPPHPSCLHVHSVERMIGGSNYCLPRRPIHARAEARPVRYVCDNALEGNRRGRRHRQERSTALMRLS